MNRLSKTSSAICTLKSNACLSGFLVRWTNVQRSVSLLDPLHFVFKVFFSYSCLIRYLLKHAFKLLFERLWPIQHWDISHWLCLLMLFHCQEWFTHIPYATALTQCGWQRLTYWSKHGLIIELVPWSLSFNLNLMIGSATRLLIVGYGCRVIDVMS
jgi:hypothetical protein